MSSAVISEMSAAVISEVSAAVKSEVVVVVTSEEVAVTSKEELQWTGNYKNKAVYTAYVTPLRPTRKSITYGRTDRRTDGPTHPLIEMRGRARDLF